MPFYNKFVNWKQAVIELNGKADALDEDRDTCYQWMADKIKLLFRNANLPVPSIHFETDASKIVCSWNSSHELIIPYELILDLHMSFRFDKVLTTEGYWENRLIFYPFNED